MRRLLLPTLLLAACSNGSKAPPAAPVTIEPTIALGTDNAIDATRACIRAAFDLERLMYVGVGLLNFPRPIEEPQSEPGSAVISREIFGAMGGSVVLTWDDRDGDDEYTSGDVFTMAFEGYNDQSVVLDGTMQVTGLVIAGRLPSDGVWIMDGTLELLNLTLTIGSQQWPITTKIPFHFENRLIVELLEVELPEEVTLGPYTLQPGSWFQRYAGSESVSHAYGGAVYAADLDGVLTYSTKGFMGGFPFFADPTTGLFHIEGAEKSLIELEPGFFTLNVRIDADGDGVFEEEQVSSFFALAP
ncbi:MAG: hypothetical protein R3F29_01250 [Planctomycetota bacterium]